MVGTADRRGDIGNKYPILVHAIRVAGTKFTFYKTRVERSHMKELDVAGIPRRRSNVQLTILRYPPQTDETVLNA